MNRVKWLRPVDRAECCAGAALRYGKLAGKALERGLQLSADPALLEYLEIRSKYEQCTATRLSTPSGLSVARAIVARVQIFRWRALATLGARDCHSAAPLTARFGQGSVVWSNARMHRYEGASWRHLSAWCSKWKETWSYTSSAR